MAEEEGFDSRQQRRGNSKLRCPEVTMFEKNGKYFADWRTPDGVRHRKSLPTAIGAKRYETIQKALRPQQARSAAAVHSSKKPSGSVQSPTTSNVSPVKSRSRNSAGSMSRRSSKAGRASVTKPGTTTHGNSGSYSMPFTRLVRRSSVLLSRASAALIRAQSGRPKTKRVGVSAAPTSDSAGLSLVPSTLVSGTRQPKP